MGIFNQKPSFKVAAPTIRKVVVPVKAPKPKPKFQFRDSSSAPPTVSRSSAGAKKGTSNGSGSSGVSSSSARKSKTLSESPRTSISPTNRNRTSQSPYPTSDNRISTSHSRNANGGDRKRKLVNRSVHRASPASERIEFGNDSDTGDDDWEATLHEREHRKRKRINGDHRVDPHRQLVHPILLETLPKSKEGDDDDDGKMKAETKAETKADAKETTDKTAREADGGDDKAARFTRAEGSRDLRKLKIIHARDVASLAHKCVPVLGAKDDDVSVQLQYPGSRHKEFYELVWGKEKIDAVKDIKTTIKHITEVYLTDEQAVPFVDSTTGIIRQLERASSEMIKNYRLFKSAVEDFNNRLLAMHDDGTLAANLAKKHELPRHFVAFVLDQVYDRTVAPKVDLLRKYENGSDNVYGELLHPFITDILVDRLKMTSDQVFVDLGSGVGNVVLQAALEIGCESWGCEMMENACNLADEQKKEFTERCRLWGIAPGKVHLQRGDFRVNPAILDVLKRADVVLVNNQAFTSQLNDDLVRMFLDFKSGCKIVSLKSFVHDHKSASYNMNDVGSSILDVELLTYPQEFVSWTSAAGSFCISTRH
ncbi:Nucleosomal histone H3-Lys79 methylase [Sporothrix curviconia]|uniref:Histone-lysine N-methyltransferase, H3 lysine-79 specific n=1 Tax=Sporothrix curviconia TaxID=1260050 RepID=A0ABP0ATS7_9PEZI